MKFVWISLLGCVLCVSLLSTFVEAKGGKSSGGRKSYGGSKSGKTKVYVYSSGGHGHHGSSHHTARGTADKIIWIIMFSCLGIVLVLLLIHVCKKHYCRRDDDSYNEESETYKEKTNSTLDEILTVNPSASASSYQPVSQDQPTSFDPPSYSPPSYGPPSYGPPSYVPPSFGPPSYGLPRSEYPTMPFPVTGTYPVEPMKQLQTTPENPSMFNTPYNVPQPYWPTANQTEPSVPANISGVTSHNYSEPQFPYNPFYPQQNNTNLMCIGQSSTIPTPPSSSATDASRSTPSYPPYP